jgi:murein L,D-transpeptidase YcbB/YkuD
LIKFGNPNGLTDNLNQRPENRLKQTIEYDNDYNFSDKVRECLLSRLIFLTTKAKIDYKTNLICSPELLLDFYLEREVRPLWVIRNGLHKRAKILIKAIEEADHEGLNTEIYHLVDISNLLIDINLSIVMGTSEPAKFAKLDLLLTDAFFAYGFHLSEGIINPDANGFDWHINKPQKNLAKILESTLYQNNLEGFVARLQPRHSGYLRLKAALLKYQNINKSGGRHKVPAGPKMGQGDRGKRIAALHSRLITSGDLPDSNNGDQEYFDEVLEEGVKRFQARHGLEVDGIVGSDTLSALNIPVEDRIKQIRLNMERWRWLPQDFGRRHILVNTANFELNVIEDEQIRKTIRAIVGKTRRPTPVLSRKITFMELNPYWNIPHKIALNDILPRIKKDPHYLVDQKIRVFENWKSDAKEISPESIAWDMISKANFIYKLRQDPNTANALGRIKFIFPNEFAIYLHDTPARELFSMTRRTFSSGCIRIEKPIELAAYLLQENTKWDLEKIIAAVESRKTKIIILPDPVNIHILYWTAWVDKDGTINFRDDIYGRDDKLNIVFNGKAGSPQVLYGKNSEKNLFSSQILPTSNRSNINMNEI